MDFEVKEIPDEKIAVINYKGPIGDMDLLVAKLMDWVESNKVKTIGKPFVIYYSPRHSVNEGDAVFDVGIAIDDEDQFSSDSIRVADFPGHKVLTSFHEGNTDNILESYEKLVDCAVNENYDIIGSPKEVLIKSIYDIDNPEEFITEIQLPIIKK